MDRPILLVDGDNALYRAYYKFTNLTNKKREPTSIIFGFPYVLRKVVNQFHPKAVYCVFDSGSSVIRRSFLPDYRKREQKLGFDSEGFNNQKQVIQEFIRLFNVAVVREYNPEIKVEADDLIYSLSREFKNEKTIIVSADKDFNQLVSDNLSIFNPFKDVHITIDNFNKIFNLSPSEFLDYLILTGDKSDNIPGYPGMGDKRGMEFINNYGSIKAYLEDNNNSYSKKIDKDALQALYKLNRLLINLRYYNLKYVKTKPTIFLPKTDTTEFRKICMRYDISKFNDPQFMLPFKSLKYE